MRIEILYFDECPNRAPAVERIKEALRLELLTAELIEVNVQDARAARSLRFVGSPTVRNDGNDIEITARTSKDFGVFCRTYSDKGKRVGIPPLDLIRSAMREADAASADRRENEWDPTL
ncbi:MAG: hypothetical protein JWO19_25 [Bryobacterales bacterium]|nr:hypothetical protein [Bryobacterales bacterium]